MLGDIIPEYRVEEKEGKVFLILDIPNHKFLNGLVINSIADSRLNDFEYVRVILKNIWKPGTTYTILTSANETKAEGIKYDLDKPLLYDFLTEFSIPLTYLEKIYKFGRERYGKENWKKLENGKSRFLNAMMRHIMKIDKEVIDEEVGTYHLAHVAYNALMALHYLLEEVNK